MSEQKLGILCFSPGFGGLEINTLRLAGWLQADGWEVPLLLRAGTALPAKAVDLHVTIVPEKQGIVARLKEIHRWVKAQGIQVLMIPFNKDLKIAALYKRFFNRRIKLIYQQHMQVGIAKRDLIHTLRYAMLDAWISPLAYLQAETLEKTKVPAHKIHIIPFGIEVADLVHTEWTREAARTVLSLPQAPRMIGVLGRIDRKKGQDLVIKAIHQLRAQGHPYHLLLLGDATLNEGDAFSMELKALVAQYDLADYIHFRAYQPQIQPFFKAIDIFAMPSHGETFGMVTLEAMAAGVPVIGTDTDGTKEILQDGKLGYLFPLQDVAAFCRQVVALEDNAALPALLQQARQEVIDHYNKERMCRSVEELVTNL